MGIIDDTLKNKGILAFTQYRLHFMAVLCLMAGADGKIEEAETKAIHKLVLELPEFKDLTPKEVSELTIKATNKINAFTSPLMAVRLFKEIVEEEARKKCFWLAVRIALSTNSLETEEKDLLEKLQNVLKLSDQFVQDCLTT